MTDVGQQMLQKGVVGGHRREEEEREYKIGGLDVEKLVGGEEWQGRCWSGR